MLGAGGSARSVVAALRSAGADVGVSARRPEAAAELGVPLVAWPLREPAGLIVNATPVAQSGDAADLPLDPAALDGTEVVCDLVYRADGARTGTARRGRAARRAHGGRAGGAGRPGRALVPHVHRRRAAGRRDGRRSARFGMRTLITGGSGGIGLALARICARHGHDLVLVSRSADLLAAAQAELRDTAHADVEVLACDLSLPGAVERVAAAAPRRRRAGQQRRLRHVRPAGRRGHRSAARDAAAERGGADPPDPAVPAVDGRARIRPDHEPGLDGRVPAGAEHGRVLRDQGVRAQPVRRPAPGAARHGRHRHHAGAGAGAHRLPAPRRAWASRACSPAASPTSSRSPRRASAA